MSEKWDIYTIDRKVTGKTCFRDRMEILNDDEFHMWIMVWIKNPKTGKYLISQRAASKDTHPLKWETVGGHSIVGENSLDAAVREVYEEVGIKVNPDGIKKLATKIALTYDGYRHNWIRDSFYYETTDEPDLERASTDEVAQTKWMSVSEIEAIYKNGECCPNMRDLFGFEANPLPADRYRDIIGQIVKGKIDRPIGSYHPRHAEMYYSINYGYVDGIIGGDGAYQDIYLWGEDKPVHEFVGKVIAVYHRYNDNETKWIVIPCDKSDNPTDDEIYAKIAFQEQFFSGVLIR